MWNKYPEIQHELKLVEDYIRKSIASSNKLLSEITYELVESGGKRLRPAFLILSSKFGRYNSKRSVSMAGAVEILHAATLVHDDVVDRSGLRRGRPTISARYGNDMAVYTGDFLFTQAVLMMSKEAPSGKLDIIARAVKTICEGEVDQYQSRYTLNTTVYGYLKRISRKTAALFGAACALGAYSAKCPKDIAKSLLRYGYSYGMAFQIRDDLHDLLTDREKMGKPVGKDILEGIVTLPAIYAMRKNSKVRDAFESFFIKKDISIEKVPQIITLIKESGGIEDAEKMLRKYVQRGKKALEHLPDNDYKVILNGMIEELE